MDMRSIEPSGGSVFEGTTSGCDAVEVGSCSHCDRRLVGTSSTLEAGLDEHRHTEPQHANLNTQSDDTQPAATRPERHVGRASGNHLT